MNIRNYLKLMVEKNASDMFYRAGGNVRMRIDTQVVSVGDEVLTGDDMNEALKDLLSEELREFFHRNLDVDFAVHIPEIDSRFRVSIFRQRNWPSIVVRNIRPLTESMEELILPAAVLKQLCLESRGLVLLTGSMGSGKSTTLAAMVDHINANRRCHIMTMEDPIEFVHVSAKAVVNHREVGLHTESFSSALRGALREDPDIILVGEMRDLETISLAIEAASTGHLVFSTLHTSSAWKTVDRVIEVFPSSEQPLIRSTLADGLRAVVSQTLFKRIDKKGRVVALEILIANPAVRNLIREAKTHQIPSMIQTGKKYGMILLDDYIMELFQKRQISAEEAYAKANEKSRFRPLLNAPPEDFTEV